MKYDVEIIIYYDHARKVYEWDDEWLRRSTKNTLTLTSIGAVVYEDKLKVDLVFSFSTEKVEIDEIIKSAIVSREKVGVVEMEMLE